MLFFHPEAGSPRPLTKTRRNLGADFCSMAGKKVYDIGESGLPTSKSARYQI